MFYVIGVFPDVEDVPVVVVGDDDDFKSLEDLNSLIGLLTELLLLLL